MATIKITFTAPEAAVSRSVASICGLFAPQNAYIDLEPYAGTVYDTNIDGWGEWEGLAAYLGKITNTPNVLIMFKAAARDGEVEFEEADAKVAEYYKELGDAFAEFGFAVTVNPSSAASGENSADNSGASSTSVQNLEGGDEEPMEDGN